MKNKVNIFLADDLHQQGIDLLKKKFNVVSLKSLTNKELILKLKDLSPKSDSSADALIVRSVRKIDRNFLQKTAKNTNIKLICTVSAGFDNIDTIAASEAGIDIMNVAGANSTSAAEFTMGLILAAVKNIVPANSLMQKGTFDYSLFKNAELSGKTIGIIGVGRIGSKVAALAKSFGMKIIGNDINESLKKKYRFIKFVPLNTLLRNSDIVTIHTPLDNTTRYLINKKNISLLRNDSVLINTARGGVVEEAALLSALKKGKLRCACIDVFEQEPGFNKKFLKLKNLVLTPHLAGKTSESRERMAVEAVVKVTKYFQNTGRSRKLID